MNTNIRRRGFILFIAAAMVLGSAYLPLAAPVEKDLAADSEDACLFGAAADEVNDVTATAHGDINSDGITDLVIMHADNTDYSTPPMGKAYVYFGRAGIAGDIDLGTAADLTIEGRDYCGGFWSVACGDYNGDGYDDVIIGAPYDTNIGMLAGTVNVVFGRDDYSALPTPYYWYFTPATPPDVTLSSEIPSEFNGMSVTSGDFNNDGYGDIAWGAPAGNGGVHFFDGASWSTQVGGNGETLNSVCMFAANNGWAVGDFVSGIGDMTLERWNGSRWRVVDTDIPNPNVDLYGVHGNAANSVWAVGEAGTIVYWNGSAWSRQLSGVTSGLNGVYATAANDVYAVGDGGVILHNDGTGWSAQASNTTSNLNAVYALDAAHVWAVGDGGVIRFTSDGGASWSPQASGTTAGLNAVFAADATHAWAVGVSGAVRHYDGISWGPQDGKVSGRDLKGVTGTGASDVWACGAGGALTHYDGTAWTPSPQGFTNHLNAVGALASNAVWQVGDAYTGRAYISFGQASPPAAPSSDVTINGIDTFDYAGRPLATGHYDPDAYADLLIGANIADGPGNAREDAGEAYIIRGRSSWTSPVIDLDGGASNIIYGADAFDQFPEYAQNPSPDFDRSGLDDLLLGTRNADGPGNAYPNCGETYVIYGGSLPYIVDLSTDPADITFHGGAANQEYGYGACAFDFNNDELTDVFVTSVKLGLPPGRVNNGVVSMVNGRESWPAQVDLDIMTDMYVYGAEESDAAGLFVSGANLHNTDPGGFQDLVISSRASGPGNIRPRCGEHYVFLGYDNIPPTCEMTSIAEGDVLSGRVDVDVDAYDYFGVTRVEFFLDGVLQYTDTSAPYHWDWDTLGLEDNRDYAVKAVAYDPHGNSGTDTRTVRLNNALPTQSREWYLAEGSTVWTFEEWVLIQNPGSAGVNADVTFMKTDGTEVPVGTMYLPPTSRRTVNVAAYVGQADVSTKVEAGSPVICERAMYWNDRSEGHVSIGTTSPSPTWYLAEGSTAHGFEEWVLIQNPNPDPAEVEVAFMKTDGTVIRADPPLVLPPTSRRTINVADYVGEADVSTEVEADIPVIVERAMYRYDRQIGHDSVGTPSLSRTWYLAEGFTGGGFDEWVLIQNPGTVQAAVAVEFMKMDGTVVPYGVLVPPLSRYSIHVNTVPGCADAELSTYLSSNQPIIAERAMYWNGTTKPAGHVTLGTPMPLPEWYLAEGYTGGGFEEFVLVQNPNPAPCTVTFTFMRPDGSSLSPSYVVPANTRFTVKVNDIVSDSDVSTRVTGSLPIIAERAMYWNARDGGHCTIGAWGR